jgi:hypothetical protein
MDDVDIEKWKLEMEEKLIEFCEYWKYRNSQIPNNFPAKMLLGDWDEQFHWFLQVSNKN